MPVDPAPGASPYAVMENRIAMDAADRRDFLKLLVNPDGSRKELYDIPGDPEERKNLAGERTEVAERLSKRVLARRKTLPR